MLVILIQHTLLLLDLLLQLLFKLFVLLQDLGQFDFILHNDATANLLVHGLALWAYILLEKLVSGQEFLWAHGS